MIKLKFFRKFIFLKSNNRRFFVFLLKNTLLKKTNYDEKIKKLKETILEKADNVKVFCHFVIFVNYFWEVAQTKKSKTFITSGYKGYKGVTIRFIFLK